METEAKVGDNTGIKSGRESGGTLDAPLTSNPEKEGAMATAKPTTTPLVSPTPGPWRWEISLKSKQIQLCGGVPRYDLNVMDFVRWGMGNAAPRFNKSMDGSGKLMLMHRAEEFAAVVPGREHHADWFQTIDHPDARLIAAAPDLLAALKLVMDYWDITGLSDCDPECDCIVHDVRAAIAKAEGR